MHVLVDKIAHYALHENGDELIIADPSLEQIRVGDIGGSYGNWPYWVHQGIDDVTKEEFLTYQELTKEIIKQIEEYRKLL